MRKHVFFADIYKRASNTKIIFKNRRLLTGDMKTSSTAISQRFVAHALGRRCAWKVYANMFLRGQSVVFDPTLSAELRITRLTRGAK